MHLVNLAWVSRWPLPMVGCVFSISLRGRKWRANAVDRWWILKNDDHHWGNVTTRGKTRMKKKEERITHKRLINPVKGISSVFVKCPATKLHPPSFSSFFLLDRNATKLSYLTGWPLTWQTVSSTPFPLLALFRTDCTRDILVAGRLLFGVRWWCHAQSSFALSSGHCTPQSPAEIWQPNKNKFFR